MAAIAKPFVKAAQRFIIYFFKKIWPRLRGPIRAALEAAFRQGVDMLVKALGDWLKQKRAEKKRALDDLQHRLDASSSPEETRQLESEIRAISRELTLLAEMADLIVNASEAAWKAVESSCGETIARLESAVAMEVTSESQLLEASDILPSFGPVLEPPQQS